MVCFDDFKKLYVQEQKEILMLMFKKYNLMYSALSIKSLNALEKEYNEYPEVKRMLDECMGELGYGET